MQSHLFRADCQGKEGYMCAKNVSVAVTNTRKVSTETRQVVSEPHLGHYEAVKAVISRKNSVCHFFQHRPIQRVERRRLYRKNHVARCMSIAQPCLQPSSNMIDEDKAMFRLHFWWLL
jgi:hypothetical protein